MTTDTLTPSSKNERSEGEIKRQRKEIGDRERHRAGGDFRIEFQTDAEATARRIQKTHAVKSETTMLLPTTSAPLASPRHIQTIAPTMKPHAKPMKQRRQHSRGARLSRNQRQVSACDAQRLDRERHRLHAHAFVQTKHHREEKCDDETVGERCFKRAGEQRANSPAATVASSHGKR